MSTETTSASVADVDFAVNGMDCASCVAHVERAMRGVPGVRSANVSLARGRASVQFDPAQTTPEAIAAAATDAGYPSAAHATWMGWAALVTSTLALVYLGGKFYRSAWGALRRRTTNMDTLIAMGAT